MKDFIWHDLSQEALTAKQLWVPRKPELFLMLYQSEAWLLLPVPQLHPNLSVQLLLISRFAAIDWCQC